MTPAPPASGAASYPGWRSHRSSPPSNCSPAPVSVGQPAAIHARSSLGTYRTDRPIFREGIAPQLVRLHSLRAPIPSITLAALESIMSGSSCDGVIAELSRFIGHPALPPLGLWKSRTSRTGKRRSVRHLRPEPLKPLCQHYGRDCGDNSVYSCR